MNPADDNADHDDDPDVEEIAAEIAEGHDPTTAREAIELELEERGRSGEGRELGEHIE